MRLAMPIGILLVAVTAGAVVVAVWASVADAPWESNDSQGTASLLCEDALDRRKAVEDALQRPVSRAAFSGQRTELVVGQNEGPLSAFRDDPLFSDEVGRLEIKLRNIERDIERFCQ